MGEKPCIASELWARAPLRTRLLHDFAYPLLDSVKMFQLWSRNHPGLRVVTYHGVLPADAAFPEAIDIGNFVSEAALRSQLRYLKKHYRVLDPKQLLDSLRSGSAIPTNSVLVTCDDGLMNNHNRMPPILEEERVKALFFVTSAALRGVVTMLWYEAFQLFAAVAKPGNYEVEAGSESRVLRTSNLNDLRRTEPQLTSWLSSKPASERDAAIEGLFSRSGYKVDELLNSPEYSDRFRLMGSEQVRGLLEAGHSIGSHTVSHPMLSLVSCDECRSEICGSKQEIEAILGKAIWAIAFPFGGLAEVGEREYRLAEEAGYEIGFMNIADRRNPKFGVPRTNVGRGTSLAMLAAGVSGFHDYLRAKLMAGSK